MSKFILSAFADEISNDIDIQMDVLDKYNIKFIEFRSAKKPVLDYTKEELLEIKKKLDDRGFKISALGSPIGKVNIDTDFNRYLEIVKRAFDVAHILNTRFVRIFSFYVPSGKEDDYEDIVIDRIGKMVSEAEKDDIELLHENEKAIYGDNAERCLKILKSIDSQYLWATFDPANFVQCGVNPYPDAYELLKDYIKYVHIKDAKFDGGIVTPAGEGDGNVSNIVDGLNKSGYEGFLSIEPHLNNSLPGGGPDLFDKAYTALKNILNKIENI